MLDVIALNLWPSNTKNSSYVNPIDCQIWETMNISAHRHPQHWWNEGGSFRPGAVMTRTLLIWLVVWKTFQHVFVQRTIT